jgi:hypothetical protein
MPKPVAITYGVSRNELIFHEVPASSDVTFKHDNGKVGKISVTGGSYHHQKLLKNWNGLYQATISVILGIQRMELIRLYFLLKQF